MKAQINDPSALFNATKSVLSLAHHHHHHHQGKSESAGRVTKHHHQRSGGAANNHRDTSSVTEEMQVYFSKLKELVPFMPRNRKLSKLEIIQYVIDYICDLQLALEAQPTSTAGGATGLTSASSPPTSPINRQPLGVIANGPSNTALASSNTCAAQEANHHDKLPSHLEEVNTRPVSC